MRDVDQLLTTLAERQGSDLHLKVGSPPLMRFDGVLGRVDGEEPLRPEETEAMAHHLMSEDRWRDFLQRNEADLAYSLPGVARFRVNVFRQRGSVSVVLRLVRVGSPSFDDLGLPPVVRDLADEPRGLVLVTGPTGSGKTTTLSAMIDHVNATRSCHIVTIEDPIEVIHPDQRAAVNQREVGVDTESFITAMRAAMRQDPDVILIGEMRDTETVQAALAAAETGHLVLSTLHTIDATETVNRIVDFFPPFQQQQVRVTLAGALKGVVCQRLVPRRGGGRIPALEVCVNTGRVAERIIDSSKTYEIEEVVADGSFYGMQTFDQALVTLVKGGTITVEDALEAATSRHDFELALQQAGVTVPA
ncbi:MAG TPA: PilT/PilU family type 4a pilus ATPase [Actinomycetota bacterium]|nr:PilT/PilU family type 4a pilus ATPase [Actinomycetota bacterium]